MKNNACEQYPFYKKLEQCPDYERAAARVNITQNSGGDAHEDKRKAYAKTHPIRFDDGCGFCTLALSFVLAS